MNRINTTSRFVIWGDDIKCGGKYVHGVCVFSFPDLPVLISRPELFANKFQLTYNPVAYECMEKWILARANKSTSQIINKMDYCKHPVVKAYNKIECNQ
jgi:hypothetical protein